MAWWGVRLSPRDEQLKVIPLAGQRPHLSNTSHFLPSLE
jgi:hypothetical protein